VTYSVIVGGGRAGHVIPVQWCCGVRQIRPYYPRHPLPIANACICSTIVRYPPYPTRQVQLIHLLHATPLLALHFPAPKTLATAPLYGCRTYTLPHTPTLPAHTHTSTHTLPLHTHTPPHCAPPPDAVHKDLPTHLCRYTCHTTFLPSHTHTTHILHTPTLVPAPHTPAHTLPHRHEFCSTLTLWFISTSLILLCAIHRAACSNPPAPARHAQHTRTRSHAAPRARHACYCPPPPTLPASEPVPPTQPFCSVAPTHMCSVVFIPTFGVPSCLPPGTFTPTPPPHRWDISVPCSLADGTFMMAKGADSASPGMGHFCCPHHHSSYLAY